MGCVLCSITRVKLLQEGGKIIDNPFYQETEEGLDTFLDKLASDIADVHPGMVEKINKAVERKKHRDQEAMGKSFLANGERKMNPKRIIEALKTISEALRDIANGRSDHLPGDVNRLDEIIEKMKQDYS